MARALFMHYEQAGPEYTLKVAAQGAALTVGDALARFVTAYASTGHSISSEGLELLDGDGKRLDTEAVLPCGLPAGADVFVRSSAPPTQLPEGEVATAAAAAAAAVAAAAAATPSATIAAAAAAAAHATAGAPQKGVYAKAGSAIAASQAKMGENSYYYSVGRNRNTPAGGAAATAPAEAPQMTPKAVVERPATLKEQTLTTYSMLDDERVVKVYVPLAGAGVLAEGAISCDFRERSFDLRVTAGGKVHRLHVPILLEEIEAEESCVKKKASKLIIVLKKKDADKGWYELRKTKGVGDSEFHKLVPDAGDSVMFTL
jgi:hypothetical protein